MEKRRCHYDLGAIQAQMAAPLGLRMTASARHGALAAGLVIADVAAVIQGLDASCFYKSMTTLADHRVWQDVYHARWRGKGLYVKFQQDESGYFTVSFKER